MTHTLTRARFTVRRLYAARHEVRDRLTGRVVMVCDSSSAPAHAEHLDAGRLTLTATGRIDFSGPTLWARGHDEYAVFTAHGILDRFYPTPETAEAGATHWDAPHAPAWAGLICPEHDRQDADTCRHCATD